MSFPAFSRWNSPHQIRSVVYGLFTMKSTLFSCETLTNNLQNFSSKTLISSVQA